MNLIPFGKDCAYRITVNAELYNDGIWHPLMTHIYPHKSNASATNLTASTYSVNLSFVDQDINETFHVTVPSIVGAPPSSGAPPDQTEEIQIDIGNTINSYNARWSGRELGIAESQGPDFYGVPLTLTTINPGKVNSSVIEASCQNYTWVAPPPPTPVTAGLSTLPKVK